MAWPRVPAARVFSRALTPLGLAVAASSLWGCRVRILDRSESDERSPIATDEAVTARTWDLDTTPFPFRPPRIPPFDDLDAGVLRSLATRAQARDRNGVDQSSDAGVMPTGQQRLPSAVTSAAPGAPRRAGVGGGGAAPLTGSSNAAPTPPSSVAPSNDTPTPDSAATNSGSTDAPAPRPAPAATSPTAATTATKTPVTPTATASGATTEATRGGPP